MGLINNVNTYASHRPPAGKQAEKPELIPQVAKRLEFSFPWAAWFLWVLPTLLVPPLPTPPPPQGNRLQDLGGTPNAV